MAEKTGEIKTVGRSIVCELPSGEKFLFGEIDIDCPHCGPIRIRIPDHHMRAVLRLLAEWVDEHPELTGGGEIKELYRERFSGQTGGDPTQN